MMYWSLYRDGSNVSPEMLDRVLTLHYLMPLVVIALLQSTHILVLHMDQSQGSHSRTTKPLDTARLIPGYLYRDMATMVVLVAGTV